MIRTAAHAFVIVFILVLVCACEPVAEPAPVVTTAAQAALTLPVADMTPARNSEDYPTWREVQVLRDRETGCEYLLSPTGDLEPRMEGHAGGGYVREHQRGCRAE